MDSQDPHVPSQKSSELKNEPNIQDDDSELLEQLV